MALALVEAEPGQRVAAMVSLLLALVSSSSRSQRFMLRRRSRNGEGCNGLL